MPRRAAARNNERVGNRRTAFKVDGDDVFRLVGVERGEDA
jgi:hypothetical protein